MLLVDWDTEALPSFGYTFTRRCQLVYTGVRLSQDCRIGADFTAVQLSIAIAGRHRINCDISFEKHNRSSHCSSDCSSHDHAHHQSSCQTMAADIATATARLGNRVVTGTWTKIIKKQPVEKSEKERQSCIAVPVKSCFLHI